VSTGNISESPSNFLDVSRCQWAQLVASSETDCIIYTRDTRMLLINPLSDARLIKKTLRDNDIRYYRF